MKKSKRGVVPPLPPSLLMGGGSKSTETPLNTYSLPPEYIMRGYNVLFEGGIQIYWGRVAILMRGV